MDLGDPRESLVSLKTPGTWEADNRVEERWQWGAQLLDLCNLSPEDYKNSTAVTVKTIQDCGECGGGGGGGDVTEDKGNATLNEGGIFTVTFDESVNSKLYVFVTFTDDVGEDYSFQAPVEKGSDTATFDVRGLSSNPPYKITKVEVGFKEDGSDAGSTAEDKKYEYSVDYGGGGGGDDKLTYLFTILCTKTDELTGDDFKAIIDAQGQGYDEFLSSYDEIEFGGVDTAEALFFGSCTHTDKQPHEGPEEDAFFAEHSYDFVFLTQKEILEIKESITDDTEFWVEESITMDGKTYHKWMRRDLTGAQCPYTTGSDDCSREYPFILKIKK